MGEGSDEVSERLEQELEPLWRFALKLSGKADDAADLVQRTCLRALEQRASYRCQGKLRSWLFRIEHRIWLNEVRARQIRNHRAFSAEIVPSGESTSQGVVNVEAPGSPEDSLYLSQIADAVESLPEAQRLVMVLINVEGFSYRETAEILDVPIGTIMSRLARGRLAVGRIVLTGSSRGCAPMRRNETESVR